MDVSLQWLLLAAVLPLVQAAVPGTFFWKPRVELHSNLPGAFPRTVLKPTLQNVRDGYVVMINGYQVGVTLGVLAGMFSDMREEFPQLHPGRAHYYTNFYRWAVRHLSLYPEWVGATPTGARGQYMNTHRVWTKRYFYLDLFLPKWVQKLLWFVPEESWKTEEWEWRKYIKYAEPHFGKYYRYPSKQFNHFNSHRIKPTVENLDITDASVQ